ncbi:flavin-linked sulfhydryl oxidase SCDLUD_000109 [Saccharomycodes ludwigii]|uniref:flavin-linked sulfhydryl oxidase n=1 Tax=Saccharomycodes ludwigii TaxID=36035 RepID=UPI001E8B9FDC|nr:hypothetical protein SCDLUD_000109 [Saccharomycodes ludwigii]KAH3902530.1 hypothetical protein SCDLUD_000109 [Saccharomycodes ludwigii]
MKVLTKGNSTNGRPKKLLNKRYITVIITSIFIIYLWFNQLGTSNLSYQTENEEILTSIPTSNSFTNDNNYENKEVSTSNPSDASSTNSDENLKDFYHNYEGEIGQQKLTTAEDMYSSVIMPKMPDQEAKRALGNASWKYFHTLLARFPDHPTQEQRDKLNTFLQLYAELYPCGECSYHFVKLMEKYPPQTSSRTTAALWGCHVHNLVNEHLKKPEYDCTTILEDYDCGCGDDASDEDLQDYPKGNNSIITSGITLEKEQKQLG